MKVALLSLERWDDVWRRNQYLTQALLDSGRIQQMVFVNPPVVGRMDRSDQGRLVTVTPNLRLPKRVGGLAELGRRLAQSELFDADVVWVNDPSLGVHALRWGQPAVYDVTDDWRWADAPYRIWKRIVRAEDELTRRATVVVCSEVLRRRWSLRYGVDPVVVQNGIDEAAWKSAQPRELPGQGPHVGYVGTLHEERLDIDLTLRIADHPKVGTVHLVGPSVLDPNAARQLQAHPKIRLTGAVPAGEVAAWTVSFDLLVSPHLVSPFTLSLDAIKSHEYLASGRPIVATPTSGFQHLASDRLEVAEPAVFVDAVARRMDEPRRPIDVIPGSWTQRAEEFADVLDSVAGMERVA